MQKKKKIIFNEIFQKTSLCALLSCQLVKFKNDRLTWVDVGSNLTNISKINNEHLFLLFMKIRLMGNFLRDFFPIYLMNPIQDLIYNFIREYIYGIPNLQKKINRRFQL